jgi:hypothetical protein
MAVLDAKKPAWQASTKAISPTKAEAKLLEGKAPLLPDGGGALPLETRVLLKDQAKAEQNGLFEVTKNECFGGEGKFAGAGNFAKGENWALKRPEDADSGADVTHGMTVPVEDGVTNESTTWIQVTPDPIEVGVTAQTFEALRAHPGGVAGGGLEGKYAAPELSTPVELPEGEAIKWESEGKTVAEVVGLLLEKGTYSLVELLSAMEGADNAAVVATAQSKSQGAVTGVQSLSSTSAANSYVQALASGNVPYIIKGDGKSDFLRLPSTANRRMVSGQINAAGSVVLGSGFTCTRTATGKYTIKFNEALASAPIVTGNHCGDEGWTFFTCQESSAKEAKIIIRDGAAALANEAFNFYAMG